MNENLSREKYEKAWKVFEETMSSLEERKRKLFSDISSSLDEQKINKVMKKIK